MKTWMNGQAGAHQALIPRLIDSEAVLGKLRHHFRAGPVAFTEAGGWRGLR